MTPAAPKRALKTLSTSMARAIAAFVMSAGALGAATITPASASTAPSAKPFGTLVCAPKFGVTFCQGGLVGGQDRRVPSFDGVPIDADLTLPSTGQAPYPLIVLLQGLAGNKLDMESTSDDGALDNVTLASRGWAVLTYSARGFGNSCGTAASRLNTPACAKGWVQFADQRYEIRDTQYLAGMLVDEGYARPGIAVSGISYGGGQSLELAMLKNRTELLDGKLVPFVSPKKHIAMTVAAAYAVWPWDDLDTALVPNGRLSSTGVTPAKADRVPVGVAKEEWDSVLYEAANEAGYLPPAGVDPDSDLTTWERDTIAGEPFSSGATRFIADLQKYKSAISIPMAEGGPAPIAIQSGFTDTLFPVSEALHFANAAKAGGSKAPILLVFDDVGHPWAQDKKADVAFNNKTGIGFLDSIVLHHTTPRTGVMVREQTCPATTPSGPTVSARSWGALEKSTAHLGGSAPQTVTSVGGNPLVALALDGVSQPLCNSLPAAAEPGTATYTLAAGARGLHVLGGVTIKAKLHITGDYPELVGRLWDVAPDGTRQIVEMGAFRPSVNQARGTPTSATAVESISFDLPPNDYDIAVGDTLELELVGSNAPFFRPSNGAFSISVSELRATVPLG
ncbi:MAG: CocE/NonD family hydrolase, partial [Acidimicrobiales bacterium]